MAADAGYCVNQCGNACYKNTAPSCFSSCVSRCTSSGPSGGSAAPTVLWGALAAGHPPDGSVGYATHFGNAAAARARALAECRKVDTGRCDLLLSFSAPMCAAGATAWNGNDSEGTYANSAQGRRLAEQQAMAQCTASARPGTRCQMIASACASD